MTLRISTTTLVLAALLPAGCGSSSSGPGGTPPLNGCSDATFTANDHTAAGDPRAISFPAGQAPAQYSPSCMTIKVGQTVTWSGAFSLHPLEPAGGDASTPIALSASGTSVSFTFAAPGTFGFNCANHPNVMFGAIRVAP
jgi:plastocyanin